MAGNVRKGSFMEILFKDRDIVVAVKPRGVLSEGDAGEDNMPALLLPLVGKVYPVHRLDRGVGGVMVYARNPRAAATLSRAVQAGELQKEYTAVVTGAPDPAEGEWRDLLYHDVRANKTFVVDRERRGAREAVLRYRVSESVTEGDEVFSRVSVRLLTGRSHQIRVQFASRKHPLVGDGKYGSRQKAAYPALAATALSFKHPTSGKPLSFAAPTPEDFPWSLFGSSQYEIERKLLIAMPDTVALARMAGVQVLSITQTYLTAPTGETRRVREVREGDAVRYIRTVKRRIDMLRAVEEENTLSEDEYRKALEEADPARHPIQKTRYRIPFAGHTVEVDVFDFWKHQALCEVELASEDEAFLLPPCLSVLREVSDDKRYKNVNLAREIPREE